MRDDLVKDKILRWEFARKLWANMLDHSAQFSDSQLGYALYRILIKLGVALPIGGAIFSTLGESALWSHGEDYRSPTYPPDMLVIMRMGETLRHDHKRELDECTKEALRNAPEVTLKWEFDSAGSPYGLIERIIPSCHTIGVVERSLCWRYGALFHSREFTTRRFGQNTRLFTMAVRYNSASGASDGDRAHILTVRMIGRLEDLRVWAALRYVASAVVMLSK